MGGRNCLKYLKRRWNRTEGRGHKDFKKGWQAGQEVGAIKRGGGWNPPTNYGMEFRDPLMLFGKPKQNAIFSKNVPQKTHLCPKCVE